MICPTDNNEDHHLTNKTMFSFNNEEGHGLKVDYLEHDGDLEGFRPAMMPNEKFFDNSWLSCEHYVSVFN